MASDVNAAASKPAGSGSRRGTGTGTDSAAAKPSDSSPLIPLSLVDGPTQRVYVASAFIAVQTYKLYSILGGLYDDQGDSSPLGPALLIDFVFVVAASRLRTPRIDFSRGRWTVLYAVLASVDWLLCGGWRTLLSVIAGMPVLGWVADFLVNTWSDTFNRQLSISEHRVRLRDLIRPSHHILGQHTIHILPYSTAAFAPTKSSSALSSCFCLDTADAKAEVSIPVIFNNTEPQFLSYSITPFDSEHDEDRIVQNVTISKSALTRLGRERRDGNGLGTEDALDLELEDADDDDDMDARALVRKGDSSALTSQARSAGTSNKEMVYTLSIKRPGRIRLERVLDRNKFDARISRSELLIVECPKMGFTQKPPVLDYCPAEEGSLDIWVRGLAPLELRYTRAGQGASKGSTQQFAISHIAADDLTSPLTAEGERADQLAVALRGSRTGSKHSLRWAAAQNVSVPITVDTLHQGRRTYHLDSVRDACGNVFEGDDRATAFYQDILVHPRPAISFDGCSQDKPIDLLQGGAPREIGLHVQGGATDEGPFTAQIEYQGDEDGWTRNVTFEHRSTVQIDQAGLYTLKRVQGRYCFGEAGSSWMCVARVVPPPTASIQFDPIQDPCAGPVGVKALAVLSGKAPFRVRYRVQRQGKPPQDHEQTILRTREEIEFRPSAEGEVTYTFTGLSDANYRDIALQGPSFTQILHPVAKASFDLSRRRQNEPDVVLHSCQGDVARAQVNFEGVGPFEVTYAVRADGGELLGTHTVKDIKTTAWPFEVQVPRQLAAKGGAITVTLTSVKDAKGCERPLTVPDLYIEVRRSKPTAAFVEPRDTSMLEGKEVQLPLRLAGEAPWTVGYRLRVQGEQGAVLEKTFHHSESALGITAPGEYEIVEVRDRYCLGSVSGDRAIHTVTVKSRPEARFSTDAISVSASSGNVVRPPVCLGQSDSAGIVVQGHFPVSVTYDHRAPGAGETVSNTFNAAQKHTSLQLITGVEGEHVYELTQVGDAVYASARLRRKDAVRLEQTVHPLPLADFEHQNGLPKAVSLCLGEALSHKDKSRAIPPVRLTGTPPFTLEYAIKDGLGVVRKMLSTSEIASHKHSLEVEQSDFPFDGTGKWSVDLVRVVDGNGCERSLSGAEVRGNGLPASNKQATMEVEVVESANISPVGTRGDYCVGETIEFVLQGSPPWTVEYDFEGRKSKATVKSTTFSRVAESAGKMHVRSIGHQHNRCQTSVEGKPGMTKTVHALPTVHIREGSHFVEDLREGNQAEIVFRLYGEPPFSFTYQRTQAVDRFSRPQVLETHTVTNIEDKAYTITTAEEGTWSVIWLQDRWCAVSIDMAAGRSTPQGEARRVSQSAAAKSGMSGALTLKKPKGA